MDTVFELIRDNKELNTIQKNDPDKRLAKMFDMIFKVIFQQFSPSLLYQDKVLFALRLSQIRMGHRGGEEFEILMKTPTIMELSVSNGLIRWHTLRIPTCTFTIFELTKRICLPC